MKLVPRLHLRMETGLRSTKNLLRAQMKELASMDCTSMWIALLLRHVNTSPQRLQLAEPPRVSRERIVHGPKKSNPTFVKGGGYFRSVRW